MTLWQRTLRGIATTYVGNLVDSARMFALAILSAADALIGAWDAKVYYNFWRPITAIRNADTDGNSETIADPNWAPFIATGTQRQAGIDGRPRLVRPVQSKSDMRIIDPVLDQSRAYWGHLVQRMRRCIARCAAGNLLAAGSSAARPRL
jgi:hypothetical protein